MKKSIISLISVTVFLISCSGFQEQSKKSSRLSGQGENGDRDMIKKEKKTDEEWKKVLTPLQYQVMRKGSTERPFTGKYNLYFEKGVYHCAGCGTPLFSSETKYDYGTGWPSFTSPVNKNHILYLEDNSFLMKRIEVRCAVCGAHLGHVFDDGPAPTHKHYCINSVSLDFEPSILESESDTDSNEAALKTGNIETATFAAGCFWGVEHKFRQAKGVLSTRVGYTGGHVMNPSYEKVCLEETGHAEAVEIKFDPSKISYGELLEVFFRNHDPTQLNRQGFDIGAQYRSAIFYNNDEQKEAATKMIERLKSSGRFLKPIVTQIAPVSVFYEAEQYHQQYIEKQTKGNRKGCGSTDCAR